MREPQLEDFMAELEAKDFSLVQLLVYGNKRNKQSEDLAYEKITQTLWFLDESRAETVADEILRTYNAKDRDVEYLSTVSKNLMMLYPLSQEVVLRVLKSFSKASDGVMDGMYLGRETLKCISTLNTKFTGINGAPAHDLQKYAKEVQDLKDKIQECDESFAKAHAFMHERDRLLKVLEQKKKESSKEAQEAELARLQKEIADLERDKLSRENEIKAKTELRRKLKEKLDEIKDEVEPTGEKRTLQRLLKGLPELDREDGEE